METTLPLAPQLRETLPRLTLNLEPVEPVLGHYYHYTPRCQLQTLGKRLLEQSLLAELAPKDKEHQRKRIMRQFFSDVTKSADRSRFSGTEKALMFWRWVKSLNPDNVNSEERYKSMSYEFLDRLLAKEEFCEVFLPWVAAYGEGLTDEDGKTRAFITFIQKSAEVKREIEAIVGEFMQDWEPNRLPEPTCLPLRSSLPQPTEVGFYLEGKCFNERCANFRRKSFFHFGSNTVVNYKAAVRSCVCESCKQTVNLFSNVGLMGVMFAYEGQTTEQEVVSGKSITIGYTNCDEVQFYVWSTLSFHVVDATEETATSLQKLLMKVYREAKVPRKRAKLNPQVKEEPSSAVQSKEDMEMAELKETVEKKKQEMKHLAEASVRMTEVISRLKQELEQLYAVKMGILFPAASGNPDG